MISRFKAFFQAPLTIGHIAGGFVGWIIATAAIENDVPVWFLFAACALGWIAIDRYEAQASEKVI